MSLLVLSARDVEQLLAMDECIEAMADVLVALARDKLYQPLRFVLRPPGVAGLLGLMPAHRGGEQPAYSLKEIVVTPDNPKARGLDAHQGGVLLHDGVTGELTALLNASPITAIRTAAVSAVATRALARPGASSVAIIGTGVQGKAHEQALRAVLGDVEIRLWSRTSGGSPEQIVREADVVCTCTSSRKPVVRLEWLKPGAHVNAVGAIVPARELDSETVAAGTLFVDRRESALNESGEYRTALEEGAIEPEHIRAELGEVLIGSHPGRTGDGELTIFKSLGLAVEDLAAAELVVARAREQGVGVEVEF